MIVTRRNLIFIFSFLRNMMKKIQLKYLNFKPLLYIILSNFNCKENYIFNVNNARAISSAVYHDVKV